MLPEHGLLWYYRNTRSLTDCAFSFGRSTQGHAIEGNHRAPGHRRGPGGPTAPLLGFLALSPGPVLIPAARGMRADRKQMFAVCSHAENRIFIHRHYILW